MHQNPRSNPSELDISIRIPDAVPGARRIWAYVADAPTPGFITALLMTDGVKGASAVIAMTPSELATLGVPIPREVLDRVTAVSTPPTLTSRSLRNLPLGEMVHQIRDNIIKADQQHGTDLTKLITPWIKHAPHRPGRQGHPDVFLLEWTIRYLHQHQRSSSPMKDLSEQFHVPRPTLGDRLKAARRRGLLTDTTRGQSGGSLTAKARGLASAHDIDTGGL